MLSRLRSSVPRRKRSDPGGGGGGTSSILPTHHVLPAPSGRSNRGGAKSRGTRTTGSSSSSNSRPSSRSGPSGHTMSTRRPGVIRAVPHGVPPGSVTDDGVVLPGEAMCTSFLLGGAYYPGKDKRARSHLKRAHLKRTLWYRVMCSSRRRVGLSLMLGAICVAYLGGPLLNRILDLGARLAGRRVLPRTPEAKAKAALEELFPDLAGKLRPAEQYGRESKWTLKAAAMHRYGSDEGGARNGGGARYGAENARMELLGDIDQAVSDFIHRNDRPVVEAGKRKEEEEEEEEEKEEGDVAAGGGEGDDADADAAADLEEGDDEALDNGAINNRFNGGANVGGGGGNNVDDGGDDEENDDERGGGPDEDMEEIAQEADDEVSGEGENGDDEAAPAADDDEAGDDGGGERPPDEDFARIAREVGGGEDGGGGGGGGNKNAGGAEGKTGDGENDYAVIDKKAKKAKRADKNAKEGAAATNIRTLQNAETLPSTSSCPSSMSPDDINVTLVTQTTLDRAFLLERACTKWGGAAAGSSSPSAKNPMIAVLFLPDDTDVRSTQKVGPLLTNLEDKCPHLKVVTYIPEGDEAAPGHYPMNKLRNMGLDLVATSHVLVIDADFVPSEDLAATIKEVLVNRAKQRARDESSTEEDGAGDDAREALVVPVYDRLDPKPSGRPCRTPEECSAYARDDPRFLPSTFRELRECRREKRCIPFQSDVNWEGHYTTRSDEWLDGNWYHDQFEGGGGVKKKKQRRRRHSGKKGSGAAAEDEPPMEIDPSRAIRKIECFDSMRYEPWTVVRWCPSSAAEKRAEGDTGHNGDGAPLRPRRPRPVAPYYDERFSGYGKNKIQWVSHVRFRGYTFRALPRAFAIHHPHPESVHKEEWLKNKNDLHRRMDRLYPDFLDELAEKYEGGRRAVPECEEWRRREKEVEQKEKRKRILP